MKKILALLIVLFIVPLTVSAQDFCEGNFDCDQDVDGTDAAVFKADFGRSPYNNPCPNCPPPALVPKTGQTTSYATGDDGDLQKGVEWPNPRFTDNADGTITDNLTGLIWLKNADCFGRRFWPQAMSDCNGLADGQCGLTDGSQAGDWRLPNLFELESLRDMNYYDPVLSNAAGTGHWTEGDPFNNVQLYRYWSSTTTAANTDLACEVRMRFGDGYFALKDGFDYYVWPVRGGQSGSVTTTTTITCKQQGESCLVSLECCDGCCCNAQGLNVCTTTEQCGFLGGGCD